jgi:S-adenosylhomocysteine hydrolase
MGIMMTTEPAHNDLPHSWSVLRGPGTPGKLHAILTDIASAHGLHLRRGDPQTVILAPDDGTARQVTIRWQQYTPARQGTLGHVRRPGPHLEILIDPGPGTAELTEQILARLSLCLDAYSDAELDQITATMPLVARYATPDLGLGGWALIFRDHYVENTLGFLLGTQRAGIPPSWIYALAKGDRTLNRDRVHATLVARGFASGVLDNTAINAPGTHAAELERATAAVDTFIDAAHAAGRRVLVIDDGGLLARGYGRGDAARRIDAAIELTVSGLKRIAAAGPVGIPVLNLARSQLKTCLGYPEIADSCLRRLRALLPAYKITGRPVLVVGYGTLGSRLAAALASQGCQVHVADTDPLALITAAQAGYRTYRTAREALHALAPFLVVGTTGDDVLSAADLALLPDGVFLAPFATRDFSLLTAPEHSQHTTSIPGIGCVYRLTSGRDAIMLGDGRSLNLFEADAIPNQGYDAYRAGTLIAAGILCRQADQIPAGVHTSLADEIIRDSGLYNAYYDTYLAAPTPGPSSVRAQLTSSASTRHPALAGLRACVVGYGAAGRLHAEILTGSGAELTVLDPKHQDLPKAYRSFPHSVDELPDAIASSITLWSVCCPTADHLPVLRSILGQDPEACVLLEKPACQSHEIGALAALLASYRNARVVITDQYRHARALPALTEVIARLAPGQPIDRIGVTFSKDRSVDILRGRFVDRSYGVLGYEWLHMLAVLAHLLPPQAAAAYLADDPQRAELWATYHAQLFVAALTERTSITVDSAPPVQVELASSITSPTVVLGSVPPASLSPSGQWRRGRRPSDDRHRHIVVHAGQAQFTAHLDPVTAPEGWQLDRNQHRITASRDGQLLHDEVIDDSPLHNAIRNSVSALLSGQPPPAPDLAPLRRIAALADYLRAQQPPQQQPRADRPRT